MTRRSLSDEVSRVLYVQSTPFPTLQKVRARLWNAINGSIFRATPWFARGVRRRLLQFFGAKISKDASIHNTATILYPWRLTVGSRASIGEGAYVSCLDEVVIEDYAIVGQYAVLETGSHDISDPFFTLITRPVTIGYAAWICPRSIILPGVSVGAQAVVGAGAVCRDNVPALSVVVGNPAAVIKTRKIRATADE